MIRVVHRWGRPHRRPRLRPHRADRHYQPRQVDDAHAQLEQVARRTVALGAVALVLSSCGSWKGIANVPLPGGPGTGGDKMTIYVQMPDTLALNVNSRVRVADVYVGRVRSIELKNWVATLTLDLQPNIKLPENTLAKIGQTSLLGSQHVQLDPPPDPSSQPLRTATPFRCRTARRSPPPNACWPASPPSCAVAASRTSK